MKLTKLLLPLCYIALSITFAGAAAPTGSAPEKAASDSKEFVYADFETVKDNHPLSNQGGAVQLMTYSANPANPCTYKGMEGTNVPELVHIKKDDPNRAIAFEYHLSAPNDYAGVGVEIQAKPWEDGVPGAEDLSDYSYLTVQLYVTGIESIVVELISKGHGIEIQSGSPQMSFKVQQGFNTYKVPFKSLGQPSWVEHRVSAKDILKNLTSVTFTVSCNQCTPLNGTVVIDNVVFHK